MIFEDYRTLNKVADPEFSWADMEKQWETNGRTADFPTEIQTLYLANANLQRHGYINPLDISHNERRKESEGV